MNNPSEQLFERETMKNAKIAKVTEIQGKPPRTAGGGGIWRRLISSEETDSGMLLGFGVIKPGEARGWHIHPPGEDEIFFVMEGRALAEWIFEGKRDIGDEISTGTAFYTPVICRTTSAILGNRTFWAYTALRDRSPLCPERFRHPVVTLTNGGMLAPAGTAAW